MIQDKTTHLKGRQLWRGLFRASESVEYERSYDELLRMESTMPRRIHLLPKIAHLQAPKPTPLSCHAQYCSSALDRSLQILQSPRESAILMRVDL